MALVALVVVVGPVLAIGSCALVVGTGLTESTRDRFVEPVLVDLDDDTIATEADFSADVESLLEWLPTLGARADAGPYLNPRLAWQGVRVAEWRDGLPPNVADRLTLPEALLARPLGTPWTTTQLSAEEREPLDFGWMEAVHAFDHWELSSDGPPSLRVPTNDRALPDLQHVTRWSLYRLLEGQRVGDLPAALRDVHQLARLLLSTEDELCALVAANLYEYAAQAAETWAPGTAIRPSIEDARRLRRAARAGPGFLLPSAPGVVFGDAVRVAQGTPLLCLGATKSSALAVQVYDILEDTPDLGPGLRRLREVSAGLDTMGCRGVLARAFWDEVDRDWVETWRNMNPDLDDNELFVAASLVPTARPALAYFVYVISLEKTFVFYEEPERNHAPEP